MSATPLGARMGKCPTSPTTRSTAVKTQFCEKVVSRKAPSNQDAVLVQGGWCARGSVQGSDKIADTQPPRGCAMAMNT